MNQFRRCQAALFNPEISVFAFACGLIGRDFIDLKFFGSAAYHTFG
jgi:hypothetical protein